MRRAAATARTLATRTKRKPLLIAPESASRDAKSSPPTTASPLGRAEAALLRASSACSLTSASGSSKSSSGRTGARDDGQADRAT